MAEVGAVDSVTEPGKSSQIRGVAQARTGRHLLPYEAKGDGCMVERSCRHRATAAKGTELQNYRGKLQLQSCSRTDERSSTMENSYSGVHRAPIKLAVSCRLSELSLFFGHWNRGFLVVPSRGSRENSRSYGKLSLKLAHDKGRAWGQGTETASYCHGGTVEGLLPAVCEFLSTQMSSRGQPG